MKYRAEIRHGSRGHKTQHASDTIHARNIDEARAKAEAWAKPKFGNVSGNWFDADIGWMALLEPPDINQPRHYYWLLVTV